jgi:predicted Zn-dependent protease
MILSERAARDIAERVLAKARADSASLVIGASEERNLRFARNGATTNGLRNSVEIAVTINFGKRSGTYTTSQIDEAGLTAAVEEATRIARIAPENAEFMPPLPQQTYAAPVAYHASSARADARRFADLAAPALAAARARDVLAAGYLEGGASCTALANSAGLFAYQRKTDFDFTVTARTPDGTGSGWAAATDNNLSRINAGQLGGIAIDKAVRSRSAVALEPGRYTVVLESSPAADLVGTLRNAMDARSADEGRSAFAKRGGGSRIGERIVSDKVTLRSDPTDPIAPNFTYGEDGQALAPHVWIDKGVLRDLPATRYWAQHSNRDPRPRPSNIILEGGTATTEELVRSVSRGILVTRFWYIRFVDPRTLLLTGLTRDGLFLIENGEIAGPVRNMRWNESPLAVLSKVEALGRSARARGTEQRGVIAVPPILAHEFTFSSASDAV